MVCAIIYYMKRLAPGIEVGHYIFAAMLRYADDGIGPVNQFLCMQQALSSFFGRLILMEAVEVVNGEQHFYFVIMHRYDAARLKRGMPDAAVP